MVNNKINTVDSQLCVQQFIWNENYYYLHIVFRKVNSAFLDQLRANESHKTTSLVSYEYIYLHVEQILFFKNFYIRICICFVCWFSLSCESLFFSQLEYNMYVNFRIHLYVYTSCFYILKTRNRNFFFWVSYLIRVCFIFDKHALYKWLIQKNKY